MPRRKRGIETKTASIIRCQGGASDISSPRCVYAGKSARGARTLRGSLPEEATGLRFDRGPTGERWGGENKVIGYDSGITSPDGRL